MYLYPQQDFKLPSEASSQITWVVFFLRCIVVLLYVAGIYQAIQTTNKKIKK